MKLASKVSLVLIATSLVASCHLFSPVKSPNVKSYTLGNAEKTVVNMTQYRSNMILLVNMPIADAQFDSSQMMYETERYELSAYVNNQWAAPPAQMLLPILADAMRKQAYFKGVMVSPFTGVSDYYLDARLLSIKQTFITQPSSEILALQATLLNGSSNRAMMSKRFTIQISAAGNDPYSGVVAANKAAELLSQQIAVWVVKGVQ